jgi:hypothetical protein
MFRLENMTYKCLIQPATVFSNSIVSSKMITNRAAFKNLIIYERNEADK